MEKPLSTKLESSIHSCLDEIAADTFELRWKQPPPTAAGSENGTSTDVPGKISEAVSQYRDTLRNGLLALLGQVSLDNQAWQDALEYARAVIEQPEDNPARANSAWNRSCSDLHRELLTRYGAATIEAARIGSSRIGADHYDGDRLSIAHVDKKASFKRHWHDIQVGAAFYPTSSFLAAGCYEVVTMDCSLVLSICLPPKTAVQQSALGHLSLCDDYAYFTESDYDVRLRLCAMSLGAAYAYGGRAVNGLLDASMLQAVGTGTDVSVKSAMSWRAVGGAATTFSGYVFANDSIEDGLAMPEVMMAMHDMLDWRSDVAAGNHENGVSAVYGIGFEDPFHAYLEATLQRAASHPLSGVAAISGIVYMHFTGARYASYEYHGTVKAPCSKCIQLLKDITAGAGIEWNPKAPPATFAEGSKMRDLGKLWADRFEDHGLTQEAFSWFQSLITTGNIWLFDVLVKTVDPVDTTVGWA